MLKTLHVEDILIPTSIFKLSFLAKGHVDRLLERIEDMLMLAFSRKDNGNAKS